jgi:hypothetical protein
MDGQGNGIQRRFTVGGPQTVNQFGDKGLESAFFGGGAGAGLAVDGGYGIDAQGCCRAKYGSYVGGVYHTIYYHDATAVITDVLNTAWGGATHGTQYASGEGVAGEGGQHVALAGVYGYVATTCYDVGGIAFYVFPLAQQCQRFISGIESYAYYLGTLGYKYTFVGFYTIA